MFGRLASSIPRAVASTSGSSSSAFASSSRLFTSSAQRLEASTSSAASSLRPVPPPTAKISTPTAFLEAISHKPQRDLTKDSTITGLVGEEEWEKLWQIDGPKLRKAGTPVKDRRYLLWAMEKFRQGLDPIQFKIKPKPKKEVRGWGPRVQKNIRISGRMRPGEKRG